MNSYIDILRQIKSLQNNMEKMGKALDQLRSAVEGEMPKKRNNDARDAKIFRAYIQGATMTKVAEAVGLTQSRVRDISLRHMRRLKVKNKLQDIRPSTILRPKNGDRIAILAEDSSGHFSIIRRNVIAVYDDGTVRVNAGDFRWPDGLCFNGATTIMPYDVLAINPPSIPEWFGATT